MKWNELKRLITNNGLAWTVFGLLLLSDWKLTLLLWIIPLVILFGLEWKRFGRRDVDWEITITPIINFYALTALILGPIIKWIDKKRL